MSVERALERMERAYRLSWLALPLGVVLTVWGAVDLFGARDLGWRIDAAFVACGGYMLYTPLSLRSSIRRIRRGPSAAKPTRRRIAKSIASMVGSVAVVAAFGYLVFGVVGAIASTIAALAFLVFVGMRMRRILRRGRATSAT